MEHIEFLIHYNVLLYNNYFNNFLNSRLEAQKERKTERA